MSRTFSVITVIFIACLLVACFGGLVWANMQYVHEQPIEKDFLVPWLGARTFIQYGDSPYSEPATQRAQILYYGKLAAPDQDPLMLWLPFPVELFYFPIALISNYVVARALWMTLLEIALGSLAYITLKMVDWNPGRIFLPVVLISPILWIYGVISLTSASAAGIVALALAGFLVAIHFEKDELAGGLLIILVSAARIAGVFVILITWWIIYQRRWRIFIGFFMGLGILLGLAFLFLPDWIAPFIRGILLHYSFNPGISSTDILASWSPVVGSRLGWVISGLLGLILLFAWGNSLRKDFKSFVWTASLTMAVTPLLGIPMHPDENIFLFIPFLVFLSILAERWTWLRKWGVGVILLFTVVSGIWFFASTFITNGSATLPISVLMLGFPVFLIAGLYWMRWWFFHSMQANLESSS
jgi:hypothetical protein